VMTVEATGDYGKPRPAVIVQTDALPAAHASVVVCQAATRSLHVGGVQRLRSAAAVKQETRFRTWDCRSWIAHALLHPE
jgi:mRNA-degrading endonuclease toxin of MazEF toxin-antitoxin module